MLPGWMIHATAVRHLAAARELFQRALQGASVAFHARLEGAFTKQGTSIAVRLLVIDKRAGSIKHRRDQPGDCC
jgi:hypothetical protein